MGEQPLAEATPHLQTNSTMLDMPKHYNGFGIKRIGSKEN